MTSRFVMPFADVGSGIKPSSGAKLFFFEIDGVTPKDTFSDQLSTPTPNANPVISDSNGVFSDIYIDGAYKVTLQDKNGSQIFGGVLIEEFVTGSGQANNVLNRESLVAAQADNSLKVDLAINAAGRNTKGDGGKATWYTESSLTGPAVNGTYVVAHDVLALVLVLRDTDGNVLKYGATEAIADNLTPIQGAIDHVNRFVIPKGSTIKARSIVVKNFTYGRIKGDLKMPDGSPDWASILVNADIVNGNQGVTLDFTNGEFDGNRENQTGDIHHVPALFQSCWDFTIFGGKYGKNYAPETTPSAHPDGPFNQGVPYGEGSATFPTIGMITFMGGRNNHVFNFNLIDWAQEGISPRWNEGSSITDFRAINGTPTNEPYYAPVTFGSRAGLVTVAIGDNVLVQEGHEFNFVEQQPHLIYKALVAGTYDLDAEDYTDGGRWTIVLRDITNDLGYTAARISGAKGQMNLIAHGYAAFCRASSFSNDSPISGMRDLFSYHNSFQVGINFGHSNTGADLSIASGLTAINSGWSGGVGGNSYGINIVGATKDFICSGFYVCGAGRNGINQSDSADGARLLNGIVKFSTAGGIKSSSPFMNCEFVRSYLNGGADFEPAGSGTIRLINCEDSTGNQLNNERLIASSRTGQIQRTFAYGDNGKHRTLFRDSFAVSAGIALIKLTGTNTNSDNMIITATYSERNTGSSGASNQRACRTTFLVSGSGTARTVQILEEPFQLQRKLRASWDIGTESLSIFLTDLVPADVAANNSNNSLLVDIQNHGYNYNAALG